MLSTNEIYDKLRGYLEEMFEVAPEKINLEARLFEDLDLDSIDAIDLIAKIQEISGKKIRPEQFKTVRTVGDVVERVHELINE